MLYSFYLAYCYQLYYLSTNYITIIIFSKSIYHISRKNEKHVGEKVCQLLTNLSHCPIKYIIFITAQFKHIFNNLYNLIE